MNNGILYLAFGREYVKLAYNTIMYSRQFTDLPICLLTNTENKYDFESLGVEVKVINAKVDDNRDIKTSLIKHTPFENTLYIDCDSVITRKGVGKAFDFLEGVDAVFAHHHTWENGQHYYRLYTNACRATGARPTIKILHGGFIAFRKCEAVEQFYAMWNDYWRLTGAGRDMPALACAVKNSGINKRVISRRDGLFSHGPKGDCIIMHKSKQADLLKYGISQYKTHKPFDVRDRGKGNWNKDKLD